MINPPLRATMNSIFLFIYYIIANIEMTIYYDFKKLCN